MSARFVVPALALSIAGCAGGPVPPDWQANTRSALAAYQSAYFAGNAQLAAIELERARREISATARRDLAARVELQACALAAASVESAECAGYAALAADAGATERAYAAWLAGTVTSTDASALPDAQRAALLRGSDALASIEDPLSRLVAAGVLLRAGRLSQQGVTVAIDTASSQGWRRPLLAWLAVAQRRAEAAGDRPAVELLRRRLDLVGRTARP